MHSPNLPMHSPQPPNARELHDCVHVNHRRLVTAFWCMWTMVGWKLCAQHEIVYVCGCGRLEMCDCACGLTKLGGMLETARLCIRSLGLSDCALGAGDCLSVHWEAGTCGCALETL